MNDIVRYLMENVSSKRPPDFIITNGNPTDPYLYRWYLIPRNRFFNIYFHKFLRSDLEDALHDHPWMNLSILLYGHYIEHTIKAGGVHVKTPRRPGLKSGIKFRMPSSAHRVELYMNEGIVPRRELPCWTLFVTGPKVRKWGFHCPNGWKDFDIFYSETDAMGRTAGRRIGCGD